FGHARKHDRPRWDGGDVEGKTVLLHAEQGLGDTIEFIRYARLVKERGATVLVESQPALIPLLTRCAGIDRLLLQGGSLPDFDVQCPLLSLPGVFNTTLQSIPAGVPYLSPEPDRLRLWGDRLRTVSE